MENKLTILLLVLAASVCGGANYLEGLKVLQIDPELINQANQAIGDLKNTLYQNFRCQNKQQFEGRNLRNHRLLEESNERRYGFRGARGNKDGYSSKQPSITCDDRRRQPSIFFQLYKKVLLVSELLSKVKSYILQYNNVILGNNNVVDGNSNVIIGSRNSLTGSNDWVFASDYQSTNPQDGVLIIEVYLIELTQMMQITYNPREVIHCLKQEDSNNHFRSFWNRERRQHRASF